MLSRRTPNYRDVSRAIVSAGPISKQLYDYYTRVVKVGPQLLCDSIAHA